MKKTVDLRSDTVTTPTPEMRQAMAEAEVGDDVYGEDPTVNLLQERAAEILEYEAALFVPTGSMGNQVAVKLHTQPGQEVVLEARGHIFRYEMATMAAFSGCLARPLQAEAGRLNWSQIEAVINPDVYYRTPTGLVALENTHNMAGGTVLPLQESTEIVEKAHARGLPVHLDGARIFNAATAVEKTAAELARGFDSVMFCLSKGLSAPVGSMLLGSREFIQKARRVRKMMGGGMRQVGVLASAGLIALEQMPQRLGEDHENARRLAEALSELPGIDVDLPNVQTNIVVADLAHLDSMKFLKLLRQSGVLAGPTGVRQVRFVTHKDVSREDIDMSIQTLQRLVSAWV